MDFNFSDDQEQLRDAVRKWVDKGYDFERRRAIEAAGGFSREAWDELAELGLGGLYIPEDDGGLGMGPVEGMVVMEELGRGIVLEPLAQALIAGAVLAGHADDDTKDNWLPRIAGGQAHRGAGLPGAQGALQARRVRRQGRRRPATATRVTGNKSLVPVGDEADAFLVPAQLDGKIALFLVERAASGVEARGYGTQDGSRARRSRVRQGGRHADHRATAWPRSSTPSTSASPRPAPKRSA